jgi:hypothetical protein
MLRHHLHEYANHFDAVPHGLRLFIVVILIINLCIQHPMFRIAAKFCYSNLRNFTSLE